MRAVLATILALCAALLAPGVADACPFCLSGSDETREAYWGTTVLLALLPVALTAGGVLWVRHVARLARREEALEPPRETSRAYQE